MAKYDYDLVVIGGGAAGLTCSTGAGSLGAKTLLIEKEKELGGDCLHFGCVPSKSLIKSAYTCNVLKHSSKYGLPNVAIPPVDFRGVRDRIRNIIREIQEHDSPKHIKEKYNVDTKFGQPKFWDNHTVLLNAEKITAKNFVVATGSSGFIPPIEGLKDVPFITNENVFYLDKLPASLTVLGGGPIGLEMAQAFCRLGSQVTVVQSAAQLLPKEDPDIAEFVKAKLESEGVKVLLEAKAVKVGKENNLIKVTVDQKGKMDYVFGESLLVAAGRKANVDGLDLEKAAIKYDRRGIKVDDRMRTTAKNIFACGDVNGGFQFTHVAGYEAGIAMMNAVFPLIATFKIPIKADYTKVPWCTYLDPEIANVGYNEQRAKEAGKAFTVHKEELKNNDRAKAEGETDGFIKVLINKKGAPIGVQIVAFHAGDLIHEWVAVLNGKVSLVTIANSIHAYPTLSEINKTAGLNYFAAAPLTQKIRMILNV